MNDPTSPLVVVVTGATAGLRRDMATAFGRRGHCVALTACDRHRLELAEAEIAMLRRVLLAAAGSLRARSR